MSDTATCHAGACPTEDPHLGSTISVLPKQVTQHIRRQDKQVWPQHVQEQPDAALYGKAHVLSQDLTDWPPPIPHC